MATPSPSPCHARTPPPGRLGTEPEFAQQTRTRPQGRTRAFTLLELTVVLAIIGVLTATVVMSVTDAGRHRHLRAEAERLAKLVELARDEALRSNEVWGLTVDEGGFSFQRYDYGGHNWVDVADRPFAAKPAEASVLFEIATRFGDQKRLADQFEALKLEGAEDDHRHSEADEDAEAVPNVAIYPGGDVTPFKVGVFLRGADRDDEAAWLAFTDGIGRMRALSVGDAATDDQRRFLADLAWH